MVLLGFTTKTFTVILCIYVAILMFANEIYRNLPLNCVFDNPDNQFAKFNYASSMFLISLHSDFLYT